MRMCVYVYNLDEERETPKHLLPHAPWSAMTREGVIDQERERERESNRPREREGGKVL